MLGNISNQGIQAYHLLAAWANRPLPRDHHPQQAMTDTGVAIADQYRPAYGI